MKQTPILYKVLRQYVRFAMYLFCANIKVRRKELLFIKGPLLITANHPNSFFDALVMVTNFKKPMYFLARGDIFKNEMVAKILRWLHIIPIHRISEGSENLPLNEKTFEECRHIFRNNGIVLIFIEGLSLNNYVLRPFKKGAARLAISSWQSDGNENNLQILPVGINYDHYSGFGKRIFLEMNSALSKKDFDKVEESGRAIVALNEIVRSHLESLFLQFPKNKIVDKKILKAAFSKAKNIAEGKHLVLTKQVSNHINIAKFFLFVPVIIGYILHAPLYVPLKNFLARKTKGTVFFDSVLFGSLLILYPLYILFLVIIAYSIWGIIFSLVIMVSMPLLARCSVIYKAS